MQHSRNGEFPPFVNDTAGRLLEQFQVPQTDIVAERSGSKLNISLVWCIYLGLVMLFLAVGVATSERTQWNAIGLATLGLVGTGVIATARMAGIQRGPLPGCWIVLAWLIATRGVPVRLLIAASDARGGSGVSETRRREAKRTQRYTLILMLLGLGVLFFIAPGYFELQHPLDN